MPDVSVGQLWALYDGSLWLIKAVEKGSGTMHRHGHSNDDNLSGVVEGYPTARFSHVGLRSLVADVP